MIDSSGSKHDHRDGPEIKWIVVLGAGHVSDPNVPLTSQISPGSLVRLTEAVRLHRKLPGSKIVLMGGAVFDPVPEVETEAKIAEIMHVNRNDLVLERMSETTEDQAYFVKNIVKADRFILVTSASHMPRSVALFKQNGMSPIPAPTHHRVLERRGFSPVDFLPTTGGLGKAENAIYEYLSFSWSKIRGKL
ncbi:MAG: YdcF family protein [Syntrophorhabdaceae bacterium]